MPPGPKPSTTSRAPAKRASASSTSRTAPANKRRSTTTTTRTTTTAAAITSDDEVPSQASEEEEEGDETDKPKTIPPALLTRLLHDFFTKDGTRITKDANDAVAKYMDVFVREAIARSCAERGGDGFLEVEDLEKVAPQLLLDM